MAKRPISKRVFVLAVAGIIFCGAIVYLGFYPLYILSIEDISNGKTVLETIFQAPYAGYDRAEKAELIAPRTTKISGYDRRMEAYTFYAGDLSKHMLFLNGHWLPLYEVARGGDLIRVAVKKSSKLAFLSKRMFSDE